MGKTMSRSALVAGAALFASLTVVLDAFFKCSAFKIPYPPAPFLKFGLDGLPVILSLLVFGPRAGAFSSISFLLAVAIDRWMTSSITGGDVREVERTYN